MFDLMPLNRREWNIFRCFDEMEKNFFQGVLGSMEQFHTDIVDKGDRFVLDAELPGFHKEDIQINLSDSCLTIRAQREEIKEEEQENYLCRERRSGSYSRGFDVSGIDVDRIEAAFENGVLSLQLPKKEQLPAPPSRQIKIQ